MMRKRDSRLFLLFASIFCLTACSPKLGQQELATEATYLVIASDIIDSKGEVLMFDSSGNKVGQKNMSIKDVISLSRAQDQSIYVAGERSNTNLLIEDGKLKSFTLLNDDRYGGSTAVLLDEKYTFSSMNGNVSAKVGYESLLVARDRNSGNTLYQTVVPLFTTQMLEFDDRIYLVGTNAGFDHEDAVLVIVNKETGQILDTFIYPEYREAFGIVRAADQIFVEMTRKSDLKQEILTFKNGLLSALETNVVQEISGIDSDSEHLYVLSDGVLSKITIKGKAVQQVGVKNSSFPLLNTEILGEYFYLYQLELLDKGRVNVHVTQYDKADLTKSKEIILESPRYANILPIRLMDKK